MPIPSPLRLLPYQPIVRFVNPIYTPTTWTNWKNSSTSPNQNNYKAAVRQHQKDMNAAEPLIESGVLEFTAASAMFTVHAGRLSDGYKEFPPSTTGSIRITDQNGVWVGTVHVELEFASPFGSSCLAEFVAFSTTHVSFESTNSFNVGQNSFDTELLQKLDQKARVPLMMNVTWIQREGEVSLRVAVG